MASVWTELKRRNVVRVAIAYAVASWLMIEISATTFPMLNLPEWAPTLVTVLLLIGFPIALIFAWAFEMTPEGIKKERDVDRSESITHVTGRKLDFAIIGVLSVAVVFFVVDKFFIQQAETSATKPADEMVVTEEMRSIAVLPFVNMSSDEDQEYFSDGLSEELLNLLAKMPELKVIGRTSSFAFKGKNEDLRSIGEQLGVATILEGSVRKSGERIRITAQLIDTADGAHIWSETYDRTLTDIFAVQDDVAAAITDALQIHVGGRPTRGRPTDNVDAYNLHLRAKAAFNRYEFRQAERFLLEAIELDPDFAEAYESLAWIYWWMAGTITKSDEGQTLMTETALKALALDPDLVFAQALYQSGNHPDYTYLGEIQALERAVRLIPSKTEVLDALAYDLLEAGYFAEALEYAERYVELDPLSPAANIRLAQALTAVGRRAEANEVGELAVQIGDEIMAADGAVSRFLDGEYEFAIHALENFYRNQGVTDTGWIRELATHGRDPETGQAYLDRRFPEIIATMSGDVAYNTERVSAFWYLGFGFVDRFAEIILEYPIDDSTWTDADTLIFGGSIQRIAGFTSHPKYLEIVERYGIIDLWEQRGAPDHCEKIDGNWMCK